ncbi:MAG: ABC transporter ATP-binding protein [Lactovum sp.]
MIEIKNVSKQYEGKNVLNNLSLTFEKGKIYGLLGSNGAGKTSLMKIIANRAFSSQGEVFVNGELAKENEKVQKDIFYVTEKDKYPKDIKIKNLLKWEARFFENFNIDYAHNLAKKFDLDLNKKTNALSTGYYTIFKVIVSLASGCKIMILDEPVLGIDALYRELFYEVLLDYHKKHQNLIIITTHLIDEVEPVLEDLIIIDKGEILIEGKKEELVKEGSLNQFYLKLLKEKHHG